MLTGFCVTTGYPAASAHLCFSGHWLTSISLTPPLFLSVFPVCPFPPCLILPCYRPNQHHCMRSTHIISQQRISNLDFLCKTGPSKTTSHFCFYCLNFCSVLFSLACRLSLWHHFHRGISCKQEGIHSLWRSLSS